MAVIRAYYLDVQGLSSVYVANPADIHIIVLRLMIVTSLSHQAVVSGDEYLPEGSSFHSVPLMFIPVFAHHSTHQCHSRS